MKLDNIIYDQDTLANALTEKWAAESDVFKNMYPSDTATALANTFAGYGSLLQYMLVSALANCYTSTAFSETGVYQLAETLGNTLHGNISSRVEVTLEKHNFISIATVIPAETQFLINNKKFFNPVGVVIPANARRTTKVQLLQGESITVTKTANGIQGEKFYFASDFKANMDYINVYVNGEEWKLTESFIDHDKNSIIDESELKVFIVRTDPDGKAYIQFGDNQLGLVPTQGSELKIKYVSNDGAAGNIDEVGVSGSLYSSLIFTDNSGNQGSLDLDVITTSTAFGGFGKQSIDTLRKTSPYVFASGNRAIRRQDYRAMLQNKCGYLTSQVWGEYEEAAKEGTYDSLMMNMVYYTGLKSFEDYEPESIGKISDVDYFNGSVQTNKGFLGSFSLQIAALNNSTALATIQDTGGKGFLFINNNTLDPRDSLLNDWNGNPNLVKTNDQEGANETAEQPNPVQNLKSDMVDVAYYQSLNTPTLLKPVQIIVDYETAKTIAGIKFKASNIQNGPFPTTMAMYATNTYPMPSLLNLRNSNEWTCVINRTPLTRPSALNANWTDWYPTKCFKGTKNSIGNPNYDSYKTYVIEFYSVEALDGLDNFVTLGKMKMLYSDEASIIYYDDNGDIDIKFPEGLINSTNFPMYAYQATTNNITYANGYRTGNVLAYIYSKDGEESIFVVTVNDIDAGDYSVSLNGTNSLAGYTEIILSQPVSLDTTLVYDMSFDIEQPIVSGGDNYRVNDILILDNTEDMIKVRVTAVDSFGSVTALEFENNRAFGKGYEGSFNTTVVGASVGSGCVVKITKKCMSGDNAGVGHGATIDIKTDNNLQINAAFKGNRVDTKDSEMYDQPIINKYNHFTTYLEFKQPELVQVKINAEVALDVTASITSGLIIQNIKNNVNKLFDITSDYIGKGLKLSDVYKAITATPNVKWCKVLLPTDNIEVNKNEMLILSDIEIKEIVEEFK